MDSNLPSQASLPNDFANYAMDLISSLIPVSALSFYFIDPHMHTKGFIGVNVEPGIEKEYKKRFLHIDPLHPRNFENNETTVVCSHEFMPHQRWIKTLFYQEFMLPKGFTYSTDIFFRNDQGIIAALLTTRKESLGKYQKHEIELLQGAQRFIEFSLNKIYLPPRISERSYVKHTYGLTKRELDVLECAMTGLTNKIMCENLDMRLPTLRTHLHHIFDKVGASTTSELIARIFRELSDQDRSMKPN
ncbi:helix-turn-helix transcriptional regulator [Dasania marina]|uniref:helix-turn-helix transcriptional regulator n=1 Tax=Dasania marina TaxID=471499 RepID=UPI0030DB8FA4|tara:strand:+ start:14728 stop:15465 length:738 start_codon:yes stop_codon:yes gene_type:complete